MSDIKKQDAAGVAKYDMSEVARHDSVEKGIWLAIDGNVYDITKFILSDIHFSTAVIKPYFGKDATAVFKGVVHPVYAKKMLAKLKIGELRAEDERFELDAERFDSSVLDNVRVTKLFLYPIKGCRSLPVPHIEITKQGVKNDRIYAWVNKATGKVVNQLRFPKLSRIQANFIHPHINNFDAGIRVNDILVPIVRSQASEVNVNWRSCNTPIIAWDQGPEISKWITAYINKPRSEFMLVRVADHNYRTAPGYYKIGVKEGDDVAGFQNYYSVSVVSEQSLDELNRRLLAVKQQGFTWFTAGFRLNIIVDGLPAPHYEDYMKSITFASASKQKSEDVEFIWSRRRYLCAVPQVNQMTSEVTREPMDTLSTYRGALHLNDRQALPGDDSVFFGSFYSVKNCGIISVGQQILTKYQQFDAKRPPRFLFSKL